ncbi:succinyldiaminopimelate transaminase [Alloalcanivorax xenomutans]|jgi:N-succinyldiaminopimelate aminotransferase|uniref:Succinyldiaminopimelate transaminase n=1 Tax=Alloalcanivorax xenomutans TaxID=1094342 RepID=A0A9Q3W6T7_9GAMM|nr:succinyldiaminopimelate transaminase [Alloalcanivorax xenomutans]ERS14656.1 succinyldiaminopimelate aminotransferase [Alcanivorax sp. PN-3]MBA4720768.1 succinyldiaminopimelate transaminase [Alcanivorax sp.]ARB45560.1 succinyldiaminopimelate aminotransferase [Alloalcanivorax xenomutans]MCE7509362.1 succinyldiaminopimelate transaminase [Alloalcanivorax xenomutans]PHS68714.1 MAG: succinyldiaminopimelate transaminase [Alcanivorax sp.]
MNPDLEQLHPYPFEKLATLFNKLPASDKTPVSFSIGEPQHPAPEFVQQVLRENTALLSRYPATNGLPELRQAIADWLVRRFKLTTVDQDRQVIPVNGTREALFAFTQALLDRQRRPLVLMPNPFYQIYEGATLLGGGEPVYLPCTSASGLQPDFDAVGEDVWIRTQLLFICTPGNPTGATLSKAQLKALIQLADKYDFVIASDECYSEIYQDRAPAGLLQACAEMGRHDYRRCVVFHSLSKRSNLPGLRSGFVAGDGEILQRFLRYRTYHGCAMPVHHQLASIAAWNDETHVETNRALYVEKFRAVLDILGDVLKVSAPDAGFYLWPRTPIDDESFARQLKAEENVTVLPGRYLSRTVNGRNPGNNRVRMALVAELDQCVEGAERMRALIKRL